MSHPATSPFIRLASLGLSLLVLALPLAPAHAQAIVATVNDDPITSYDVEPRIKLQKVLKRPATQQAAIEAIVADRLRLRELKKYNLVPGQQERNSAISKIAGDLKMQPMALAGALQGSGLSESEWGDFFRAEAGWSILVRGLNKGLEVSEKDVRAERDKRGGAGAPAEYLMRQIVMIVPINATPEQWQTRAREAEQFRQRFTDCTSGLVLARDTPEVVVKAQFGRAGNALPDDLRAVLDKTPIGHLTPAQRGPTGIEMVALCAKRDLRDDAAAGEDIRMELLGKRLDVFGAKLYAELRARAVIVKR